MIFDTLTLKIYIMIYTHTRKVSNLKRYKLTNKQLAKMFGYSSEYTLRSSTRYDLFSSGIEQLIEHIENQIVDKISGS
jgi:hypothetical protein